MRDSVIVEKALRLEGFILEKGDMVEVIESPGLYIDRVLFQEFTHYCDASDYGSILYEGRISDGLKGIIEFVKTIARELKCRVKELFQMLKDKYVFAFFSELKWDFDSFKKVVSAGSHVVTMLSNPLGLLLNILFPEALKKAHKKISENEIVKSIRKNADKISDWIKAHKGILAISGIAFAGLYYIIWSSANFTGDPTYDFDLSDLFHALIGKLTLVTWVASEEGLKLLTLFALALLGIGGGSLLTNFVTSQVALVIALVHLVIDKLNMRLVKGKDSPEAIAKMAGA
jgi:hypothetical protein